MACSDEKPPSYESSLLPLHNSPQPKGALIPYGDPVALEIVLDRNDDTPYAQGDTIKGRIVIRCPHQLLHPTSPASMMHLSGVAVTKATDPDEPPDSKKRIQCAVEPLLNSEVAISTLTCTYTDEDGIPTTTIPFSFIVPRTCTRDSLHPPLPAVMIDIRNGVPAAEPASYYHCPVNHRGFKSPVEDPSSTYRSTIEGGTIGSPLPASFMFSAPEVDARVVYSLTAILAVRQPIQPYGYCLRADRFVTLAKGMPIVPKPRGIFDLPLYRSVDTPLPAVRLTQLLEVKDQYLTSGAGPTAPVADKKSSNWLVRLAGGFIGPPPPVPSIALICSVKLPGLAVSGKPVEMTMSLAFDNKSGAMSAPVPARVRVLECVLRINNVVRVCTFKGMLHKGSLPQYIKTAAKPMAMFESACVSAEEKMARDHEDALDEGNGYTVKVKTRRSVPEGIVGTWACGSIARDLEWGVEMLLEVHGRTVRFERSGGACVVGMAKVGGVVD